MPCIAAPKLPVPTLPGPLTLAPPALPEVDFDPNFCCKELPFQVVPPPIPLAPGTINPGTIAIVTQTMAQVQAFLNAQALPCPKE